MESRFQLPTPKVLDINGAAARVRTAVAAYIPAKWAGLNESGISPVGQRVVVLPDMPEEKTLGGVELTPDFVQRTGMAAVTGVLVAVGEAAFSWSEDKIHPWVGRKPLPGERVTMEQFSGEIRVGPKDGKLYRVMDSRCVAGILEETSEKEHAK